MEQFAVNAVTVIVIVAAFHWIIKKILESDWIWWE
jgi:hypothetical protein